MKPLLFLQNRNQRYAISRLDLRFEAFGFDVENYWAWSGEFPSSVSDYAGAFISGSPHAAYDDLDWIHKERKLIEDLANEGVPILGSCFGSQLLAYTLCGSSTVFKRKTCEVGYTWIALHHPPQDDDLLKNLGGRLYMFVYHNDEVRADHPDIRILGSNDVCPNHLWRYADLPIWGIQGHPELTKQQAITFFDQASDRLTNDGADVKGLISEADEAAEAKRLFDNFMEYCASR